MGTGERGDRPGGLAAPTGRDPFLSDELIDFAASLRGLLASRIEPGDVTEWEAEQRYPDQLMRELAGWGLHGALLPADVGGDDGGPLAMVVVCEELGRWGGSVAAPFMTTVTAGAKVVAAGAGEPLRSEVLRGVIAGEHRLAFALSEPGAGSDAGALRTRAVPTDAGFRVSGEKTWCTGADVADDIIVVCRTSDAGTRGLTALLVPTGATGVSIAPIDKLGHRAIHTCTVMLDDVEVESARVLGPVGGAWPLIGASLSTERLTLAAQAIGLSGRVLDLSIAYAGEREQFGAPVVDIQAVAHMLADMAVQHDAARLATYHAAWHAARTSGSARLLSGAKLLATETAMRVAHMGVQVHGGYGYATEYEVERHFRDAKLLEIVGGTSQVQRNLIAHDLGATKGAFTRRLRTDKESG